MAEYADTGELVLVAACDLLVEAGKMTSDKRGEMILVSDVLGIESLCDMYVPSLFCRRFPRHALEALASLIN